MRARRVEQRSLFDDEYADHEVGGKLAAMSAMLDRHGEFLDWIAAEVDRDGGSRRGRRGVECEVILRAGIVKHLGQMDYRELEFWLLDSRSLQRFTRVDPERPPRRSALHRGISAVGPEVWERINRVLMGDASDDGMETGEKVRIDSTVTETNILAPVDNRLLYDGVRVLSRLLRRARRLVGKDVFRFHDHVRAARGQHWGIVRARGDNRMKLYRKLLGTTERTLGYVDGALAAVDVSHGEWVMEWRREVMSYRDLVVKVVSQTRRRVLEGERVPAEEKVVSLFEAHTDIIRKGGLKVHYGHKVNLSSGASGLVLDAVVEKGNPADSTRCLPMIERHAEIYGAVPTQVAFDGGYASKANVEAARAMGVQDAVFHKKRGIRQEDMASSPKVYRRLRNFRAGMEAVISYLKRCFGLGRCNWRGFKHFQAYVWSAIVSHNLLAMARHQVMKHPA